MVDGIGRQAAPNYVTRRDLPSLDEARAQLERAERAVEDADRARNRTAVRGVLAGVGVAAAGVGAMVLGRRVAGAGPARVLSGIGQVAVGGGLVVGALSAVHPTASNSRDSEAVRRAISAEIRARAEYDDLAFVGSKGAAPYNAAASTLIARFDHDRDGRIDVTAGQRLEADERIVVSHDGGPATSEASWVHVLEGLRGADTDHDGKLSGREIALRSMDVIRVTGTRNDNTPYPDPDLVTATARRAGDAREVLEGSGDW